MSEITRSALAAMEPAAASALMREGKTTVVNNPPRRPTALPEGAIYRSDFNQLSVAAQGVLVRSGRMVVDA
jgi:hypothetical protein